MRFVPKLVELTLLLLMGLVKTESDYSNDMTIRDFWLKTASTSQRKSIILPKGLSGTTAIELILAETDSENEVRK